MYKHHNDLLPRIFSSYFTKHAQKHNYSTRNAQDYSVNLTKKVFSDSAIRNSGPVFWNSLSNIIKQCKNIKLFKSHLKSNLLCKYS